MPQFRYPRLQFFLSLSDLLIGKLPFPVARDPVQAGKRLHAPELKFLIRPAVKVGLHHQASANHFLGKARDQDRPLAVVPVDPYGADHDQIPFLLGILQFDEAIPQRGVAIIIAFGAPLLADLPRIPLVII